MRRRTLWLGMRHLALLLVLGIGLAGMITVSPQSASPALAAGCYRESCFGKDPNAMGCTGAVTLASRYGNGGADGIELRYSPVCGAMWARFTHDGFNCCVTVSISEVQQRPITPYGGWGTTGRQTKYFTYTEGTWWTAMNPDVGDDRHRACFDFTGMCTDWRL